MSRTDISSGIVVLGPYRSGTSWLCRQLAALGVDFGPAEDLFPGDEWNPAGYFQRPDVRQANEACLHAAGRDPFGAAGAPLDASADAMALRRARLDWRRTGRVWGLKDPRFCLTLPVWLATGQLGAAPLLIRVRRDPDACARSLLRHPELVARLPMADFGSALALAGHYDTCASCVVSGYPGPVLTLDYDALAGAMGTVSRLLGGLTGTGFSAPAWA